MEYHCLPESFSDDFVVECWVWDVNAKSPAVQLSPCRRAVYFHIDPVLQSEGTAGVRGTKGFIHGEHYWEVKFLEPPYGTSVMVGAGTRNAHLHLGNYTFINMLGMDSESWGLSHKGWSTPISHRQFHNCRNRTSALDEKLSAHVTTGAVSVHSRPAPNRQSSH
ncbi:SPRY domain-containing SOCS box protein 3 isoform X2 [Rhincodon typus]|uniref:SPRY domain-containing SOCS box protein 3 isoform X2 n=1 Tax=Rhincodon typus TaxID=259920 RepID=UPI002030EE7B|nr:SPRY domain-containing SOCS box protein 3 isoform X2 [Rhincodon typus]